LTNTLAATAADNVSTSELPVFINLFTGLTTNLTSASGAADPLSALTAIAGSTLNTASATFQIRQSAVNQSLFQNATLILLAPVNSTLQTQVLAALTTFVSCTGSTSNDCTALNNLFQSFAAIATTVLSTITTPVVDQRVGATGNATFSVQFASALANITTAIATVNQTALDASGLLLNEIIGLASNTQYGTASQAMIFVYDSAGYSAGCAGKTLNKRMIFCVL